MAQCLGFYCSCVDGGALHLRGKSESSGSAYLFSSRQGPIHLLLSTPGTTMICGVTAVSQHHSTVRVP